MTAKAIEQVCIDRYKLKSGEVTLENKGEGKGEITVKTNYFQSSAYFGAMGSSIEEFMLRIIP